MFSKFDRISICGVKIILYMFIYIRINMLFLCDRILAAFGWCDQFIFLLTQVIYCSENSMKQNYWFFELNTSCSVQLILNLWLYLCGSLASISPPNLAVNTKCNLHHFSCQRLYDEKLQDLLVTSEGVPSQLILTILLVDGRDLKCHGVIFGGVTNTKVTEPLGNEKPVDFILP